MRQRHRSTLLCLGFEEADITLDLKAISADTSPKYIEAIRAQRDEITSEIARKYAEKALKWQNAKSAVKEIQTHWSSEDQSTLDIKIDNLKVKNRGIAELKVLVEDPIESAEERVTVAVTKKTLSVFKAMFPGRNVEDRKDIDWDKFVNAMEQGEVGFVARHHSGGAAFSVEPRESPKWFEKGKIVFHKPHPETYHDPVQMIINGWRTNKWFGWTADTFELKK